MRVSCPKCKGPHLVWECKEQSPISVRSKDDAIKAAKASGLPRIPFTDSGKSLKLDDKAGDIVIVAAGKDRNKSRHRPGYFTEYMREYRARKRAEKA